LPDFTPDETMDDVLSEVVKESGEPETSRDDSEVPVGEHVRAFREIRGMSLQQFAERTGFSTAILTQIENRMVSPSLGMLVKIANTFGTTVSSFIGGKEEREFSIVRKEDRTTISRVGLKDGGKSSYTYEALGAGKSGRKMEPFLVRLQPLSESPSARSTHDGEEFLYVLSGRVSVSLGDLSDVLEEGDSIYYNSSIPHHVHSANEREAVILAVIHAGT
jgi:transcriptional regulator with XRE-family HTH domain